MLRRYAEKGKHFKGAPSVLKHALFKLVWFVLAFEYEATGHGMESICSEHPWVGRQGPSLYMGAHTKSAALKQS